MDANTIRFEIEFWLLKLNVKGLLHFNFSYHMVDILAWHGFFDQTLTSSLQVLLSYFHIKTYKLAN